MSSINISCIQLDCCYMIKDCCDGIKDANPNQTKQNQNFLSFIPSNLATNLALYTNNKWNISFQNDALVGANCQHYYCYCQFVSFIDKSKQRVVVFKCHI